jgi:hypothetical protein
LAIKKTLAAEKKALDSGHLIGSNFSSARTKMMDARSNRDNVWKEHFRGKKIEVEAIMYRAIVNQSDVILRYEVSDKFFLEQAIPAYNYTDSVASKISKRVNVGGKLRGYRFEGTIFYMILDYCYY